MSDNECVSGNIDAGSGVKQIGMYVHIPFCVRKCYYCDFLSAPSGSGVQAEYIKALLEEIKAAPVPSSGGYVMRTVFFGGGTPSIIDARLIEEVLEAVFEHFAVLLPDRDCGMEVSIECNPGTVTEEKLRIYRNAGFNRLSFGLQSADNNELKRIGRIHTWEDFLDSLALARKAGFDNINADLMFNLPDQTQESFMNTLRKVCALGLQHISVYSLMLEENTSLYDMIEAGRRLGIELLPDEDAERNMYWEACEYLEKNGYEHYEISNFAKRGMESLHNLSYWEGAEYLGFGLGASSNLTDVRYKNTSDMERYIRGGFQKKTEVERLSKKDRMSAFMYLGLRKTKSGVSVREFEERFGEDYNSVFGDITQRHIKNGLLVRNGDRIVLTKRGVDISNTVMSDFILD